MLKVLLTFRDICRVDFRFTRREVWGHSFMDYKTRPNIDQLLGVIGCS